MTGNCILLGFSWSYFMGVILWLIIDFSIIMCLFLNTWYIIITYGLEIKKSKGSSVQDTARVALTQKYSARTFYKRQLYYPN